MLRLLNEPTAAALAYGFGRGLTQRVAVYDLGGGTFDISILEIGQDVFEVLATCGDTYLGGDDFDDRVIDLLADEFVAKHGVNVRKDPYALEKLKFAAENAKRNFDEPVAALGLADELDEIRGVAELARRGGAAGQVAAQCHQAANALRAVGVEDLRDALRGAAHARQVRRRLVPERGDVLHGGQRLLARAAAGAVGDAEELGFDRRQILHHGLELLAADRRVGREEFEADGGGLCSAHGAS